MTVAVIDSGGANLGSVAYALQRLGARVERTRDAERIRAADHVILPGVGAAGAALQVLRQAQLVDVIPSLTQPVLGICLGLQLLFEHSQEGDTACLGILPGRVTRLNAPRLPHMGWNQLKIRRADVLLEGITDSDWFYFVHSYAAPPAGAVALGQHHTAFAAVVRHNNFAACQFHPERSAAAGTRILRNFLQCR